jgi:predicted DNA-binding helix-hairpin-helix protein
MSDISKRFEDLLKSSNKKLAEKEFVIPVKTDQGILVGDVLIVNTANLKTVYQSSRVYKDIFLNIAAIKIANLLALRKPIIRVDEIYQNDQLYGKWFVESQSLLQIHRRLLNLQNFERADVIWAKYQESRDRAEISKNKVYQLSF